MAAAAGNPWTRQHGMTLIEQVMVVAITSLLLCIATPALYGTLQQNQVRIAQTDIMAALRHARTTAVARGMRTLVCPSADGAHCAPSTVWEGGWLLGPDTDQDGQPDADLRYVFPRRGQRVRVRSTAGRRLVRFQPDGSAGGSNLTLLVCDESGHAAALAIVVSNSGRVRGAPATAAQATTCRSGP